MKAQTENLEQAAVQQQCRSLHLPAVAEQCASLADVAAKQRTATSGPKLISTDGPRKLAKRINAKAETITTAPALVIGQA